VSHDFVMLSVAKDLAVFVDIPIGAGGSFATLRMAAHRIVCECMESTR